MFGRGYVAFELGDWYVHVEEQRWREPGEREFILSRRKRNDSAYTLDRSL